MAGTRRPNRSRARRRTSAWRRGVASALVASPGPTRDGDGSMQLHWRHQSRTRPNRGATPERLRDAGATVVEYALIFGLVVVAISGGIAFVQTRAEADLQERVDNAGAPDLSSGPPLPTTTGSTTTTAPPAGPPVSAPLLAVTLGLEHSAAKIGSDWIATVLVTVEDASGQPVPGVAVTGSWSAGVTGSTSCVTQGSGSCPVSSNEIDRKGKTPVPSVTLTIESVVGDNVTWSQGPTSVTVSSPT